MGLKRSAPCNFCPQSKWTARTRSALAMTLLEDRAKATSGCCTCTSIGRRAMLWPQPIGDSSYVEELIMSGGVEIREFCESLMRRLDDMLGNTWIVSCSEAAAYSGSS